MADAGSVNQDGIVFLHGIFRTKRSMARFARFAETRGYATLNLNYPSTTQSIEAIAETMAPDIAEFSRRVPGHIHFVGHSMGGLVIRAHLTGHTYPNLGRVVMLGTPNHGSELADLLQHWRIYKKLYGPAGQQLTTHHTHSFTHHAPHYELGIIAGNRAWNPLPIVAKPSDGTVSVASTRLEGMKDHAIMPTTHVWFPLNPRVWDHTLRFIETGAFAPPPRT